MNIDSIKNGIVIDHITAGRGMEIYKLLCLSELDCSVALIKIVHSTKLGRKDIIKIDSDFDIDMDILGYVDPDCTIDVIKDGRLAEKKHPELPEVLTNVIFCKNPRCITSVEEEIDHIFYLSGNGRYRCAYCEQEPKKQG